MENNEQIRQKVADRYAEHKRILRDISDGYADSPKAEKERKIAKADEQDEVTLNNPRAMMSKGFEAMEGDNDE